MNFEEGALFTKGVTELADQSPLGVEYRRFALGLRDHEPSSFQVESPRFTRLKTFPIPARSGVNGLGSKLSSSPKKNEGVTPTLPRKTKVCPPLFPAHHDSWPRWSSRRTKV